PPDVGGVRAEDTAVRLAGDVVDLLALPGAPGAGREMLVGQPAEVSGKAFVQPDLGPAATGHLVPEPLVRQFMGHDLRVEGAHEAHGLVLHAPAPAELRVAILLRGEGVGTEELVEER